jgi:hypothetical protein
MRLLAGLCVAALGNGAQTPVPELQSIRTHMMQTLANQPNYTCLETVERSRRDKNARQYEPIDTLRVEVGLVNGKEMFGWPGSKQFEDRDIRELIPSGMFGTGDFALHARSVFGTNVPTFQPRGEWPLEDHAAIRFDFQVKRVQSGFRVRVGEVMRVVGYHGSFYADPLSLDVRRLEIIGDDIPPALMLSQISDVMDFKSVPIGSGDFLLPAASEEILVDSEGHATRNLLEFSSCRQFTGKSKVSFDDPGPAETRAVSPRQEPQQELKLPGNLQVILRFTGEIDLDSVAIGDEIQAELGQDVKSKGQVVLSKGAVASGRISRVERHTDFNVLGVTFFEIASGNIHAPLDLTFERALGIMAPSIRYPSLNSPPKPREAVIILGPGRARIRQGILMVWRT